LEIVQKADRHPAYEHLRPDAALQVPEAQMPNLGQVAARMSATVEQGPTEEVLQNPMHAYTHLLRSAVPERRADLRLVEPVSVRRSHHTGSSKARPTHLARCHVTAGAPEILHA
jgi:hypothetical protein